MVSLQPNDFSLECPPIPFPFPKEIHRNHVTVLALIISHLKSQMNIPVSGKTFQSQNHHRVQLCISTTSSEGHSPVLYLLEQPHSSRLGTMTPIFFPPVAKVTVPKKRHFSILVLPTQWCLDRHTNGVGYKSHPLISFLS